MRKREWILGSVLVLALTALPAFALPIVGHDPPTGTLIWDRYDRVLGVGMCFMQDVNGAYWLVRYVDREGGTSYQYDTGDLVLRTIRVIPRVG